MMVGLQRLVKQLLRVELANKSVKEENVLCHVISTVQSGH